MEANSLPRWRFHRLVRRASRPLDRLHKSVQTYKNSGSALERRPEKQTAHQNLRNFFPVDQRIARLRKITGRNRKKRPQENRRAARTFPGARMEPWLAIPFAKRNYNI